MKHVLVAAALLGCGGGSGSNLPDAGTPDAALPDAAPPPSAICDELELSSRPFSEGPYGTRRGEIAESFTVELADGTTFELAERWSGCESYVFIPDTLENSDVDPTSIWERDLDRLVILSPPNAHYFFVSRQSGAGATASTEAMQARVDSLLDALPPGEAAHWSSRLHVVAQPASQLEGWIGPVLSSGIGGLGLSIDRGQRVRGLGFLSDVARYNPAAQWPFESNLSYAAHEVTYFNQQAALDERLSQEVATTVVQLWDGEVLPDGFAETDAELPAAEVMAGFDTLEVEVTQSCPNPDAVEFGNCGAWDYLAYLFVGTEPDRIELARFITTYHREARWVVDVSPMLVHLRDGGMQHFRWEWAPSWNTQPTATRVSLRLSNRGKGYAPVEATPLFSGGTFDSTYNDGRLPVDVAIPADAVRVELVAVVTGHGADDANTCAEFCNHQHEFTVNGNVHLLQFPLAATNAGCVPEVADGMTPNQGGTWWFGRGGWCPGQQVAPWIVDVTSQVTPGETTTVSYRGLLANATPPDSANAGNILMTSYLVVYR